MKDPQYSAAALKGGRVMIDIETLDTAPTAVVVSIGMSFDSEVHAMEPRYRQPSEERTHDRC